jgi:HK97 gp10 family phage protein
MIEIKAVVDMNFNIGDIDIDSIVQREFKETASDIEEQAKKNSPVDTGRLRASITADVRGLEANIGTDVEYAHFVHNGTYKMEARPFLESAANKELEGIEERIADAIMRLL